MPFTEDQFLNIFSEYNLSVWPLQVLFNLIAISAVFVLLKSFSFTNKFVNLVLSFLWLWMGLVYHIIFFSEINPAAYIFGSLFIIQSFLFLFFGVFKSKLTFTKANTIGIILILFALFIYPFLGILFGHIYPGNPTFGLPCPTTIFTFGILLFTDRKIPFYLYLIPFLWSLIGFTAALNLGIYEDTGLLITGITGSWLLLSKKADKTPFIQ